MTENLEQKCPYVSICVESDYGSEKECVSDYEICPKYKVLVERQEQLEEQRMWNWW